MEKAKVHPHKLELELELAPSTYVTSKQETFTVWMKSLVLNSNGCTVFDSNGRIVYRVDNYSCKACNEIFLMDLNGKVLFTIFRKQWKLCGAWEGYRSSSSSTSGKSSKSKKRRPSFQVRKTLVGMFGGGDSTCKVMPELDKNQPSHHDYVKIQSWSSNSICKILDKSGGLLAEVRRKQLSCGIVLGEDVLTMVVQPHVDHSLIMALVLVFMQSY